MGPYVFEGGQCYVALSRFRSFDKLRLIDFEPSVIECNALAFNELNRLRRKFLPDQPSAAVQCNQLPPKYRKAKARKAKIRLDVHLRNALPANGGAQQVVAAPVPSCSFVPFANQGKTCYCNAGLQALLQLAALERAVSATGTYSRCRCHLPLHHSYSRCQSNGSFEQQMFIAQCVWFGVAASEACVLSEHQVRNYV